MGRGQGRQELQRIRKPESGIKIFVLFCLSCADSPIKAKMEFGTIPTSLCRMEGRHGELCVLAVKNVPVL
jgi:hypothetical protein